METEGKNKKNRETGYLNVLAYCLLFACVLAVLASPRITLAHKTGEDHSHGKGGDSGDTGGEVGQIIPVCIWFDNAVGDGVKSDGIDADNDGQPDPYCNGELKKKVTAAVGRNFNIKLEPNNSNKLSAGRTIYLDLSAFQTCGGSVKVDVSDGEGGDSDGICDECFDSVPDLPVERFGTPSLGNKAGYPDNATLDILGRDLDGLPVGEIVGTNARLKFSISGQEWVLHYGPHQTPGGSTLAPDTEPVTVERLDNDIWRVISLTGDACLYRSDNPPHAAAEYHGQVLVPFAFTAFAIDHEETVWGDPPNGITLGEPACE